MGRVPGCDGEPSRFHRRAEAAERNGCRGNGSPDRYRSVRLQGVGSRRSPDGDEEPELLAKRDAVPGPGRVPGDPRRPEPPGELAVQADRSDLHGCGQRHHARAWRQVAPYEGSRHRPDDDDHVEQRGRADRRLAGAPSVVARDRREAAHLDRRSRACEASGRPVPAGLAVVRAEWLSAQPRSEQGPAIRMPSSPASRSLRRASITRWAPTPLATTCSTKSSTAPGSP